MSNLKSKFSGIESFFVGFILGVSFCILLVKNHESTDSINYVQYIKPAPLQEPQVKVIFEPSFYDFEASRLPSSP